MRSPTSVVLIGALAATLARPAGQSLTPGRNEVPLRGTTQEVYFYSGAPGAATRPLVLFAPGDGGFHGFAYTIAGAIASWGYDVCGLDTKLYLESFTRQRVLQPQEVTADIRTLARELAGPERSVLLVGWSEGAALMLLGAAGDDKSGYAGLITIGLGMSNVLGWRLADDLTYLTRRRPTEPSFSSLPYMPRVTPLPLAMIQSTKDEYVSGADAATLYGAARDPKRFVPIDAADHRFEGNQSAFFAHLKESLAWISQLSSR